MSAADNLSREYKQTSATLETWSTCSAAPSQGPGWWGWKWDWRGEASPEEGRPHPYTAGLQPWLLSCGEGENQGREERPSLGRALRVWPSRMESDCLTSSLYGGRQAGKKIEKCEKLQQKNKYVPCFDFLKKSSLWWWCRLWCIGKLKTSTCLQEFQEFTLINFCNFSLHTHMEVNPCVCSMWIFFFFFIYLPHLLLSTCPTFLSSDPGLMRLCCLSSSFWDSMMSPGNGSFCTPEEQEIPNSLSMSSNICDQYKHHFGLNDLCKTAKTNKQKRWQCNHLSGLHPALLGGSHVLSLLDLIRGCDWSCPRPFDADGVLHWR